VKKSPNSGNEEVPDKPKIRKTAGILIEEKLAGSVNIFPNRV